LWKTASGGHFDGPAWPPGKCSFCPLFVPLFFCAEEENVIFDVFFSHFLHDPLAPQKSIFLMFLKKSLTFVNKSGQTLSSSSIVFNDCVTHAVMFLIQRLLCVSWNRSDASAMLEGSKNCATRTVSVFMNSMCPSYLTALTHFQCSMFLWLSTLSITSVALDPLWVSGRHPHSLRLWAYESFQVLLRCFFLFAQQMWSLLSIAPLAHNV